MLTFRPLAPAVLALFVAVFTTAYRTTACAKSSPPKTSKPQSNEPSPSSSGNKTRTAPGPIPASIPAASLPVHAGALERRRAARRPRHAARAEVPPRAGARHGLRHLAADDGPLRRRACQRRAAHRAQRPLAGKPSDQGRAHQRFAGITRRPAQRPATTPIRSLRFSPCTRPSAPAWPSMAAPGGWHSPTGKAARTATSVGAIKSAAKASTPAPAA